MSKNKGFSRVMALVLLICMVVSFAPAAYADVDEAPAVQEIAVSGGQCAVLRFTQSFNDVLIAAGIPRSVMMAALTYTLTNRGDVAFPCGALRQQ